LILITLTGHYCCSGHFFTFTLIDDRLLSAPPFIWLPSMPPRYHDFTVSIVATRQPHHHRHWPLGNAEFHHKPKYSRHATPVPFYTPAASFAGQIRPRRYIVSFERAI
jgi:hypothetical protein